MPSKRINKEDGTSITVDKLRQTDTGKPTKILTPKKGPGSYKRDKDWKKGVYSSAAKVVESFIKVVGPASPQTRQVSQGLSGPGAKDISEIKVEPVGKPNQLGYVTNNPEEQGTIHIPEQNIKRQLQKAQPGVDPQTLKDQQKTLIEDVIIPHEQAHIQDVNKGKGEFSPQTEQIAEKAEDWTRMQEEYGLTPGGRLAAEKIDDISNALESKGMIKEATLLDIVSNTLETL